MTQCVGSLMMAICFSWPHDGKAAALPLNFFFIRNAGLPSLTFMKITPRALQKAWPAKTKGGGSFSSCLQHKKWSVKHQALDWCRYEESRRKGDLFFAVDSDKNQALASFNSLVPRDNNLGKNTGTEVTKRGLFQWTKTDCWTLKQSFPFREWSN